MGIGTWLIIIGEILIILGKGLPKAQAVKIVAEKYGVSEREIWQRGGF
ncbi:MAG: hypothetical protein RPR97_00935 [Colwellia sp.]